MDKLGEFVKTADWKSEKHAPVIECDDTIAADRFVDINVSIGKAIGHPNTTEHHIAWIALHYLPEGSKTSFEIGRFEFNAHGQSVEGPNKGPVYTDSGVVARVKLEKSGTLFATSYCNIHGLWESVKSVTVA